MSMAARVQEIRTRISDAARRAGRSPDGVTLIAVSKQQSLDRLVEGCRSGLMDLGESTAQGLRASAAHLASHALTPRWHFIGRLQSNKVKQVLAHARVIHSVDRLELAEELSRRADANPVEVLIQVNIGEEAQKGGVRPEAALRLAEQVASLPALQLRGLMAIPPAGLNPEPFFLRLAALSAVLTSTTFGAQARELSMGMSDDFEVAIRCGATMVRVGTAIFGERG